jgi:LacI family gluconate utilization system Gnt-I transcriptional repressor
MEQIDERKQSDAIGGPVESVTLIDVARVAGVAPMTVSRALHRPELVRSATQKKVLDAVRATGYVPNMLAGGLLQAVRAAWSPSCCLRSPVLSLQIPSRR